ncbi:MAG: hypothetical protein A3G81_13770 [Betaproteobacteria bacterium RIFCSPLOWO2_12_FULL_65_14]|nr:MAG: hypothetical protein A3G81_13770 [Betaproteobacteria bacterium RIFCSPLOWO2_12_FULL_65_14]
MTDHDDGKWERELVTKLATAALKEQRRARRWLEERAVGELSSGTSGRSRRMRAWYLCSRKPACSMSGSTSEFAGCSSDPAEA